RHGLAGAGCGGEGPRPGTTRDGAADGRAPEELNVNRRPVQDPRAIAACPWASRPVSMLGEGDELPPLRQVKVRDVVEAHQLDRDGVEAKLAEAAVSYLQVERDEARGWHLQVVSQDGGDRAAGADDEHTLGELRLWTAGCAEGLVGALLEFRERPMHGGVHAPVRPRSQCLAQQSKMPFAAVVRSVGGVRKLGAV